LSSCAAKVVNHFQRRKEKIMAKTVCKILGVVFVLVGLVGFASPSLMHTHLTPLHNLVHIVSGVLALYFGFAGSLSAAKGFCLLFGVVYLALGIIGLIAAGPDMVWHVIGDRLVFGRPDDGIHLVLGVIFLGGGMFTKTS